MLNKSKQANIGQVEQAEATISYTGAKPSYARITLRQAEISSVEAGLN
jgi:hypothetical protein